MRPAISPLLVTVTVAACSSGAPPDSEQTTSTSGATADSWASFGEASSTGTPTTGASTPSTGTGEPGSSSGEPDSTGTGTGDPPRRDDETLLRQAIAAEVDPQEALGIIVGRGGLPVATANSGFLFACLCGQGDWNLVGDHNGWVDAPMATTGPLWWAEVEIPAPDGSLYKFHEAADDVYVADPLGRRYGFDDNGRFSLVRASASHLERWFAIAGEGQAPRDLQIYVPTGGVFTHALYTHDGQNLFDPEAFWGGWALQEVVPPNMLVIGVDNTPARFDEYTPVPDIIDVDEIGGQGEAYADFIDGVVRPRMEAAYGPAAVVGTMGSSLGGLISLVIADRFPQRYDMAISLSGTVGWGSITLNNQTIIERYAAAGKRDFAVYLDSGGDGTCGDADMDGIDDDDPNASDNYCENAQLRGVLTDLGWVEGADLWYVWDPGAPHNEAAWGARVDVPLAAFASL